MSFVIFHTHLALMSITASFMKAIQQRLIYASQSMVLNCGLIVFSHVLTIPTPVTKTLLLLIEYQFQQK